MKIKNLLVADINRFESPLIIKRPNCIRRILASWIGAEITTYREVFTNTKLRIHPYDVQPLCHYIDTRYYDKDISTHRLRKLFIKEKNLNQKSKIGF